MDDFDFNAPAPTVVDDLISLAHAIDSISDTRAKGMLREAMGFKLSAMKPPAQLHVLHFGTPKTDPHDEDC